MYKTNITVERIKSLAKQKDFKISDMLNSCELNKNTLSSMQSRGSWLQANNLAKIADYLDCSVDYLLGRTDNPDSNKILQKGGLKMEKEMLNLSVTAEDGYIYISQKDNLGAEYTVTLRPEQSDLLIKWIQEAKEQLGKS